MVGLLDIATGGGASVVIRGEDYPVRGLSAAAIVQVLRQYPELVQLFGAGEADFLTVATRSEEAINTILALGLNVAGQADYEAGIARLALDEKAEVFAVILKETLPNGVVPFVKTLEKLMSLAGETSDARAGKVPSTKSQKS